MSASHVAQGSTDDQELVCYVNGRRLVLPQGRGEQTLLQFLRGKRFLLFGDLCMRAPENALVSIYNLS
jgi:hypothetical protein